MRKYLALLSVILAISFLYTKPIAWESQEAGHRCRVQDPERRANRAEPQKREGTVVTPLQAMKQALEYLEDKGYSERRAPIVHNLKAAINGIEGGLNKVEAPGIVMNDPGQTRMQGIAVFLGQEFDSMRHNEKVTGYAPTDNTTET